MKKYLIIPFLFLKKYGSIKKLPRFLGSFLEVIGNTLRESGAHQLELTTNYQNEYNRIITKK